MTLRGVAFLGPIKETALVEFETGLNVVAGASDTGKSFIVESIDFLLGKSKLRDIKERVGYDVARLSFQVNRADLATIQRSTGGGHFALTAGRNLTRPWPEGSTVLRESVPTKHEETLSTYVLSKIGLADKYLQRDQEGHTNRLSLRNLVKLVLIKEGDIIKESSPIFTGQYITRTPESSLFKLLLTGVDASALNTQAAGATEKTKADRSWATNLTKIELLDELIGELNVEIALHGLERTGVERRAALLGDPLNSLRSDLDKQESEMRELIYERRRLNQEAGVLLGRSEELTALLARFSLLESHYRSDLDRLASIEESGSLFIQLDRKACPLCGTIPDHQHLGEHSDDDVMSTIAAATAEVEKVELLLVELEVTIRELKEERAKIENDIAKINERISELGISIRSMDTLLSDTRTSFSSMIEEAAQLASSIDRFNRLDLLRARKNLLLVDDIRPPQDGLVEDGEASVHPVSVDLSTTTLDAYAQTVQKILQAWHFPDADRVSFDRETSDLLIGGQLRSGKGKGLRAITHAAMTLGLMEFCRHRNLSHPGFVILDSPLLAYYKPEDDDDTALAGSDLKEQFYSYLAKNQLDSQVLIFENEHPPEQILQSINFIDFTKNPSNGRYGFFPVSSEV